jgi:HEAT repeat protein
MVTRRFHALSISIVLAVSTTSVRGRPPQAPTGAEIAEQLRRLDPKSEKGKENRMKAISWIGRNCEEKKTVEPAIPALEKSIRQDPEWEVRQRAVRVLSQVVRRLERPCPLAVIEAMHDKEDFVRYEAVVWAALFKTFEPGATDVLLRGATADNAELRGSSLLILARVAGKDPKALAAMEKSKNDKVLDVRHSAHIALFTAKDKLDDFLPYLIRVREDPTSFLSPVAEDSELGKQERTYRNLVLLGIANQVADWSESRAEEMARELVKLLKHESPIMRRGAARLVGATAVRPDWLVQKKDGNRYTVSDPKWMDGTTQLWRFLDPMTEPPLKNDNKPKRPSMPSKAAESLETLGADAVLRKLRDDDPDRSVRAAAGEALERLASVRRKKP